MRGSACRVTLFEMRHSATDRTASLWRAKKHPHEPERGRKRKREREKKKERAREREVRLDGDVGSPRVSIASNARDEEVRCGRATERILLERRETTTRPLSVVNESETPRRCFQCADSVAACSPRSEGFAAKRYRASHSRDGSHRRAVYPLFFKPYAIPYDVRRTFACLHDGEKTLPQVAREGVLRDPPSPPTPTIILGDRDRERKRKEGAKTRQREGERGGKRDKKGGKREKESGVATASSGTGSLLSSRRSSTSTTSAGIVLQLRGGARGARGTRCFEREINW